MTEPPLYLPSTILRASYERARSVDHATQIQECADLLCCPELISSEIVDSYAAIESIGESELVEICRVETSDDLDLQHFFASQEVKVSAEKSFAFRCIATDVRPVPEILPNAEGVRDAFDYVALRPELEADPILGVAQTTADTSAYALLLRMLASFTELVPATRLEAVNRQRLKGALGSDPSFEMHLVLWDGDNPTHQELTLCEFARDLAEVARVAIRSDPALAARMGKIRCLRMDPRRFENRLWQVWEI